MSKRAAIETAVKGMNVVFVAVESGYVNMSRLVDQQNKIHKRGAEQKISIGKQQIAASESEEIDRKINWLITLKITGVISEEQFKEEVKAITQL